LFWFAGFSVLSSVYKGMIIQFAVESLKFSVLDAKDTIIPEIAGLPWKAWKVFLNFIRHFFCHRNTEDTEK